MFHRPGKKLRRLCASGKDEGVRCELVLILGTNKPMGIRFSYLADVAFGGVCWRPVQDTRCGKA